VAALCTFFVMMTCSAVSDVWMLAQLLRKVRLKFRSTTPQVPASQLLIIYFLRRSSGSSRHLYENDRDRLHHVPLFPLSAGQTCWRHLMNCCRRYCRHVLLSSRDN